MFSEQMILVTLQGLGESLYMTLLSTLVSYIIGLPLGLILVAVSYTHLDVYKRQSSRSAFSL